MRLKKNIVMMFAASASKNSTKVRLLFIVIIKNIYYLMKKKRSNLWANDLVYKKNLMVFESNIGKQFNCLSRPSFFHYSFFNVGILLNLRPQQLTKKRHALKAKCFQKKNPEVLSNLGCILQNYTEKLCAFLS